MPAGRGAVRGRPGLGPGGPGRPGGAAVRRPRGEARGVLLCRIAQARIAQATCPLGRETVVRVRLPSGFPLTGHLACIPRAKLGRNYDVDGKQAA